MIRKERSYHQNYEIIFAIMREKFEYKVKTPHEGKVYNTNCANSILFILSPFADIIIGEDADRQWTLFFAGLHCAADVLEVRQSK